MQSEYGIHNVSLGGDQAWIASARSEYALQIELAILRTMHAVLQRDQARGAGEHPAKRAIEEELAQYEESLAQLEPGVGPRPMSSLAARLEWSDDEVGFVWTAVALETHPRMLVHARALDEVAERGLSPSLYARIAGLHPERARALGLSFFTPTSPARSGLLCRGATDRSATATPWLPSPELVRYLAALPSEERIFRELQWPAVGPFFDEKQQERIEELAAILSSSQPCLVYVEGQALSGRRTATAIASSRPVLALDVAALPHDVQTLSDSLTALRREAALRGALPLIAGIEEMVSQTPGDASTGRARVLGRHLDAATGPVVLVSSWPGIDVGSRLPTVRVEWPIPDVTARAELWRAYAGPPEIRDDLDQLSMQFPLGAGSIQRAVASARVLRGSADGPLTPAQLTSGVRQNIAERLSGLATREVVKQSWDDLILADDALRQVHALIGRVRHAHQVLDQWGFRSKMPRGSGVAALFSGAPGTGKTMVAGLIARELGLDLYVVDLSKVVSKWVGETEKQLAKVFDAAEAGHVLLLFDEADALFGQRSTEMRGATDRYANLEVNFLLSRIESFNGVVVLTTNLEAAIDKAIKRRLAAHVIFREPDENERELLWTKLLDAEGAPLCPDINTRKLATAFPKMTGANIRNAALSAAFLAAAEGRNTIDQATIVQAARSEYLSMGYVLSAL